MTGIFSSKRDAEIIAAAGFFCYACSVGKTIEEQSPDPRYCIACNDALLEVDAVDRPPKNEPANIETGQGVLF